MIWCCSRFQLNRMSSVRLMCDNVTYTNVQEWTDRESNNKNNNNGNDICLLKLPYRCYVYKYTLIYIIYDHTQSDAWISACDQQNFIYQKRFELFFFLLIFFIRFKRVICHTVYCCPFSTYTHAYVYSFFFLFINCYHL